MIIVNFFTTLRSHLKAKQIRVGAEELSLLELLQHCETKTSRPFLHLLLDKEQRLLPGTMILINGQNARNLRGTDTIVRNGADVALFPPKDQK